MWILQTKVAEIVTELSEKYLGTRRWLDKI